MDISVKKAKSDQLDAVAQLQTASFLPHELSLDSFSAAKLSSPSKLIELHGDRMTIYAVMLGNVLVGAFYILKIQDGVYELYRMFIDKKYQGAGVGKKAIAIIEAILCDCFELRLKTPQKLLSNQEFYKKCGFIESGILLDKGQQVVLFTKKYNKIAVTGLRPSSGGLHLGHYVGNIEPIVRLQDNYKCKFIFADLQLINVSNKEIGSQESISNIKTMLKQMAALGVDFGKVDIIIESSFKSSRMNDLLQVSNYISNSRILSMPMFKECEEPIKLSMMLYPALQALDVILTNANVVISNIDNKFCVELINKILRKYRSDWKIRLITGKTSFLQGTDGGKMSKGKNNCIFLDDEIEYVQGAVKKMLTDTERLSSTDGGNAENSLVFKYLKAFLNDEEYAQLAKKYQSGTILDIETKDILTKLIEKFLLGYKSRLMAVSNDYIDSVFEKAMRYSA